MYQTVLPTPADHWEKTRKQPNGNDFKSSNSKERSYPYQTSGLNLGNKPWLMAVGTTDKDKQEG